MIGKLHFKKVLIGLSAILIGLISTSIVNATEIAPVSSNGTLLTLAQGDSGKTDATCDEKVGVWFMH